MNIRRAHVEELDNIYDLELLCFKDPYPKELLYILLSLYPELFMVAELDGKIVGYVVGVTRSDRYGHIVSLCVHPEYRRKRVGTKLIEYLEKAFRELFGICMYRLEVRVSNTEAINLYKKLGYRIVNTIKSYYPDGEDALLMIKNLCA